MAEMYRISVSLSANKFSIKEIVYNCAETKSKTMYMLSRENENEVKRFIKKSEVMDIKSKINQSPTLIAYYTTCLPEQKDKATEL